MNRKGKKPVNTGKTKVTVVSGRRSTKATGGHDATKGDSVKLTQGQKRKKQSEPLQGAQHVELLEEPVKRVKKGPEKGKLE